MRCLLAAAVAALAIASASEARPWRSASTLDSVDASMTMTAGFGCKIIDRKLVCGKDIGDKTGDGGTKEDKNKNKTGNICEGEIACPPGYVVLDKPNKYGACCEPKEGFPDATPAPAPAPEPKAGACQLCDNKGNCSPAGNEAECAQRKATAEQMTVTPFLKWSCKCGGGSSGTGTGGSSGTGGGAAGAVPEDASSPAPTNNDYAKCKIPETKSFAGKGCLKGHDSSALPESKQPEYVATCKGKSGIPLCGPVPDRGGQFECWCYF